MFYLFKQLRFFGKLVVLFGGVFTVLFLSGWINVENEKWENDSEIQITLTKKENASSISPPLIPAVAPPSGEGDEAEESEPEEVDVIKNGDFEMPWQPLNGVAPHWTPFSNGQAFFGWYDEQWPEAVRSGEHAQLLEINEVEANILERVVAVYQTVDVAPNAEYTLTIHAIMRTDAPKVLRNNSEYEMNWGVDRFGEGNYDNVEEWVLMPLTEQLRIGSNGDVPDDVPLFYERITGTVRTGPDTNKITLFIRGVKKFPTGTEVNFDVDDVSLVGPPPGAASPAAQVDQDPASSTSETSPAAPAETDGELPPTGVTLSSNISVGTFVIGGLVLVILGVAATAGLLEDRRKT